MLAARAARALPSLRHAPSLARAVGCFDPPHRSYALRSTFRAGQPNLDGRSIPQRPLIAHLSTRTQDDESSSSPSSSWFSNVQVPPAVRDLVTRAESAYGRVSWIAPRAQHIYARAAATSYGRLARWDKPVGTQLLFLPAAWGVAIAPGTVFDVVGLSALLYAGATLARGGGCTVNDIFDADVDRQVARTRERPVASGEVRTLPAIAFAGAQFLGGFGVLVSLTPTAFILGVCSLIPALYYPIAKRAVPWPQAVLAGTFSLSTLVGYAASADTLAAPALALYGASAAWTMVYDTVYARQDVADDRRIGVQSTALQFGRQHLAAFAAAHTACLFGAGALAGLGTPFYMGASIAAARVFAQVYETDLNDPAACARSFTESPTTGAIIWASILAGRII